MCALFYREKFHYACAVVEEIQDYERISAQGRVSYLPHILKFWKIAIYSGSFVRKNKS